MRVDQGWIANLRKVDPSLPAELFAGFSLDAPKSVAQLTLALAGGRLEEVQGLAHRLRGAAGAMGAGQLAELLSQVEAEAAAGLVPVDRMSALALELTASLQALREAIELR